MPKNDMPIFMGVNLAIDKAPLHSATTGAVCQTVAGLCSCGPRLESTAIDSCPLTQMSQALLAELEETFAGRRNAESRRLSELWSEERCRPR
jgi:hypothetical protein